MFTFQEVKVNIWVNQPEEQHIYVFCRPCGPHIIPISTIIRGNLPRWDWCIETVYVQYILEVYIFKVKNKHVQCLHTRYHHRQTHTQVQGQRDREGGRGEGGTLLCHMIISVSHVFQRSHMFPWAGGGGSVDVWQCIRGFKDAQALLGKSYCWISLFK